MKKVACAVIALLFIAGCSSNKAARQDGGGRSSEGISNLYPPAQYITRTGMGETPEDAAEVARLEIAKYFESQISGETIVNQWAQSQTSRGKTVETRMSELKNIISVRASRDIPGIEITGTKQINKTGEFQTWAVLEKASYAKVLNEKVRKFDDEVDRLLKISDQDEMTLLKNLTNAIESLVAREEARGDLSLISPQMSLETRGMEMTSIMSSIDSLISKEFDVGLVFDGDVMSKIRSGLTDGIVNAGIRLKEYEGASYAIAGGVDLLLAVKHDVDINSRQRTVNGKDYLFTTASWVLSVTAMDPKTEEVINSTVMKEKISDLADEARVTDRMVQKILDIQTPQVTSWVYRMIFKPVED